MGLRGRVSGEMYRWKKRLARIIPFPVQVAKAQRGVTVLCTDQANLEGGTLVCCIRTLSTSSHAYVSTHLKYAGAGLMDSLSSPS